MEEMGEYGDRMAAHLHMTGAPAIVAKTLGAPCLAVTRLRSETALPAKTTPIPAQAAYLVNIHLREIPFVEFWYHRRVQDVARHRAEGSVAVIDLERDPAVYFGAGFDILQFYVPRAGLADDETIGMASLSWPIGQLDPMAKSLALGLLPALERPELAGSLHVDAALFALNRYFAHAYGGLTSQQPRARGGLAPWQLRRATELLAAHLGGDISLAELAKACGLSRSHFSRAFKQCTGISPHRWLVGRRIATAKDLLCRSRLPMAEVAIASGFADQSHFTRVFAGHVGVSPGVWRRAEQVFVGNGTARPPI